MGLLDIFKRKKERTLYDELMDIPGMREQKKLFDIMSEANKGGCTTDVMPEGIGEFGLEPTNPIPTNTIQGSILYLGGLRTESGQKVNNKRLGSLTVPNIQKPIDKYLITSQEGEELAIIYISPYQAINSKKAPRGLRQVSPLL